MPTLIKNISENKKFLFALVFTLLVLVVSLIPLPEMNENLQREDKHVHGLLFLLLYILWKRAIPAKNFLWIIVLAGYGLLLEILQGILPVNRSFDLKDFIADLSGILLGVILYYAYKKFNQRPF